MGEPSATTGPDTARGIVRKTLITSATGGATFVLTNLTDQPQTVSLIMTILIGGIVLLIQFLIDFEQRQRAVEDRLGTLEQVQLAVADQLRADVRQEIAGISDATTFFDRIGRSRIQTEPIMKLAQLAADVGRLPDLAGGLVQTRISGAVALMEQLSHGGEASYEGEDRDWLLELAAAATQTIDATTHGSRAPDGSGFLDEGFWESELSYRYLELQREAIRRGVRIRRLFFLEDAELAGDRALRKICDHQLDAGIVVRTLDVSSLTPSRRLNLPGLALFDGTVSYELIQGPRLRTTEAPFFIRTRLVVRPQQVRDHVRLFEDLWELADDYR